jgi:hypothetical protein
VGHCHPAIRATDHAVGQLTEVLLAQGEARRVADYFMRSGELGNATAARNAGVTYYRQCDDVEAACRAYARAVELGADGAAYDFGTILLEADRLDEVEPLLLAAYQQSDRRRATTWARCTTPAGTSEAPRSGSG